MRRSRETWLVACRRTRPIRRSLPLQQALLAAEHLPAARPVDDAAQQQTSISLEPLVAVGPSEFALAPGMIRPHRQNAKRHPIGHVDV
eukprot:2683437-Prymnesium_polylepis.2